MPPYQQQSSAKQQQTCPACQGVMPRAKAKQDVACPVCKGALADSPLGQQLLGGAAQKIEQSLDERKYRGRQQQERQQAMKGQLMQALRGPGGQGGMLDALRGGQAGSGGLLAALRGGGRPGMAPRPSATDPRAALLDQTSFNQRFNDVVGGNG